VREQIGEAVVALLGEPFCLLLSRQCVEAVYVSAPILF
jgi:hypothetical protein